MVTEEIKVSEESSIQQFNAILDYFAISFKDIEIEDGEKAAETMKNYLVRAVMRGRLEVCMDDEFRVVHHLKWPIGERKEIVYRDNFAKAKIAMTKTKDNAQGVFMSALADIPASEFAKFKGEDVSTYSRLATVFSLV